MVFSQAERRSKVYSPFGGDALLLQRLSGRESISEPFGFQLEFLSELEELDFASVVGRPLGVSVLLEGGGERFFHGIVARFEQGAARGRFVSYRAELVPWLWLLKQRSNCRIFQQKSVPDIVRKIFTELGFSDFRFELSGTYAEREYCVQYRESDFQFISRLLEDEGIAYFFEHDAKSHTLVFFDGPVGNPPCVLQPFAVYQSGSDEGSPSGDVRDLCFERELRPGAYALNDYNFEQPSVSLLSGIASAQCIGTSPKLEVYDYPGNFSLVPDGAARVRCRMEAEECASVRVRGRSVCVAFTPGHRFDLKGHYRRECNETYLITEVSHTLDEEVGDHASGGGSSSTYENSFACMPHRVPYRSLRTTPRPIVHGVQTATVVGRPGEEIHVDPHGRVKVQFHWDREGKRNQDSSCWIRVSQLWAGKSWGGMAIPRVGQEVVVEFIEGDPDRPLITGRVYNAEQKVPYELPGGAHVMGMKSASTPGGGGYNEISIDDTKGKEGVTIHAQYDMSTTVQNDQTNTVNRHFTETIKKNASVTVTEGTYNFDVKTGTATYHVKGAVKEDFDATLATNVKSSITVKSLESEITVQAADKITLQTGASKIELFKDGRINIIGLNLFFHGDTDAKVDAPKVAVTGADEAKIGCGNQSTTYDKQKTAHSGAAINSSAVGMHEITGAVVKIN
jgi:type VI secretion system secreted protein VgrG